MNLSMKLKRRLNCKFEMANYFHIPIEENELNLNTKGKLNKCWRYIFYGNVILNSSPIIIQ